MQINGKLVLYPIRGVGVTPPCIHTIQLPCLQLLEPVLSQGLLLRPDLRQVSVKISTVLPLCMFSSPAGNPLSIFGPCEFQTLTFLRIELYLRLL